MPLSSFPGLCNVGVKLGTIPCFAGDAAGTVCLREAWQKRLFSFNGFLFWAS